MLDRSVKAIRITVMGQRVVAVAFGLVALVAACGDGEGTSSSQNTGGFSATGGSATGGAGSTNVGGARASGGRVSATGGNASATGGRVSATGGNASATGGKAGTGGSASSVGGSENTGGAGGSSDCSELEAPSPDADDGGTFTGALTIVLGNEEQLGTYSTFVGSLAIGPPSPTAGATIEDIDLTHLRVVEGDLMIRYTGLSELELPRLERVTGQFWIRLNDQLTKVRAPELRHAGALFLDSNIELLKAEFPQLETVDSSLYIHRNVKLVSWGLDALQTVGSVTITANPALPQCVVDAFNQSAGQMASSESTGGVDPPICDCREECGRLSVNCN
jgi:hypothetical protein